jgi:5-methylcytosine-specific restriction endonuclease McrA
MGGYSTRKYHIKETRVHFCQCQRGEHLPKSRQMPDCIEDYVRIRPTNFYGEADAISTKVLHM